MKENKFNKLKSMSESNLDLSKEDWLEPSDKVWINVKENLPKKRRRRNVLPFFFLFFGLSAAMLMYFVTGPKGSSTNTVMVEELVSPDTKVEIHRSEIDNSQADKNSPILNAEENSVDANPSSNDLGKGPANNQKNKITYDNASLNKNRFQENKNNEVKENKILSNSNQLVYNFNASSPTIISEINNEIGGEGSATADGREKIDALSPLKNNLKGIRQSKKESPKFNINEIEEVVVEDRNNHFPVFFGLGFSGGLTSNKKNAETGDLPLSELIKSSVYKNNYNLHFEYSKVINNKLSYSILPSVSFDQLYTTYVLNIPYDYNTEVNGNDEKENTFSHSLPTDIGNIKTKLVVSRAINSPVAHNEIINFDFTSKHKIINLSIPFRLNYHFTNFEKGFYIFPYIAPEYEMSKNLSAEYLKSNHSFVHTKSAEIDQDFEVSKFHLGLGAGLGYRLRLMDKLVFNISTNYTQYLNSHGRSNLLNAGTSLLYKF